MAYDSMAGTTRRQPGSSGTAILLHQYMGTTWSLGLLMRVRAKKVAIVRQEEVDLERRDAIAVEFVDAEDGCAVIGFQRGREAWRAGLGVMAAPGDIPLDTACEPRVADGEIAGAEFAIIAEQIALGGLVVERPQPSAEVEDEFGAQPFIFEHGVGEGQGLCRSVVVVLHGVGQGIGEHAVADEQAVVFIQGGADAEGDRIANGGEGARGTQATTGDALGAEMKTAHK